MNFASALLRIHLDVLDMTNGETAVPDQMDLHREHDGSVMILAHIGDEGAAAAFDPEGVDLDVYRAALAAPSRAYRVLTADEVIARLADAGNTTH